MRHLSIILLTIFNFSSISAQDRYEYGLKTGLYFSAFQNQPLNYGVTPSLSITTHNHFGQHFLATINLAFLTNKLRLSDIRVRDSKNHRSLKMDYAFTWAFVEIGVNFGGNFYDNFSLLAGPALYLGNLVKKEKTIKLVFLYNKKNQYILDSDDAVASHFQIRGQLSLLYEKKRYFFMLRYDQNLFKTGNMSELFGIRSYQYSISLQFGYMFIIKLK